MSENCSSVIDVMSGYYFRIVIVTRHNDALSSVKLSFQLNSVKGIYNRQQQNKQTFINSLLCLFSVVEYSIYDTWSKRLSIHSKIRVIFWTDSTTKSACVSISAFFDTRNEVALPLSSWKEKRKNVKISTRCWPHFCYADLHASHLRRCYHRRQKILLLFRLSIHHQMFHLKLVPRQRLKVSVKHR